MDKIQPEQGEAPPETGAVTGARVLVVDDDKSQWQVACLWLKALGHSPVGVSSPSDAIQRLATEEFDLLLSDIAMPGSMDGMALVRFARERYPKLRMLLASSYTRQMLVDVDLPANLIEKPYRKEGLGTAVALALRAQQAGEMTHASVREEAIAVVDRYLAGLNARDTKAIRAAFNFPHLRIGAKGNLSRFEKPEDYDFDHFYSRTSRDGWHHTGWDKTEAVFATEGKVHVAVNFTRYREDDSVIGHYFSLYVVTCHDGHWGIQVGSGNGT